MRCHCLCLCLFWDRLCVSQLPCVRYYVVLRAVFNMFVSNASPRGPMCFRCLIFNLSGPWKLLYLLGCLLDLSCGECYVISLYFMHSCCCLPTPLSFVCGDGSLIIPLLVYDVLLWCECGCS